ncbi:MAG TPA: hypothetical protein VHN11_13330 [Xanthobacteraceae bacterium]|nr:hypothetical protein [Xanthobacteraceae bacterium]
MQLAVRTVASHGKAAELAVYIPSSMRPGIAPLTSLRFFAAMVVVIFHYNLTRAIVPVPVTDFGYEAVTFFFVLSGFILAYAHGVPRAALNIGPKEFFAARLARICPAYYVGFLLVVLLLSPPAFWLVSRRSLPRLFLRWRNPGFRSSRYP